MKSVEVILDLVSAHWQDRDEIEQALLEIRDGTRSSHSRDFTRDRGSRSGQYDVTTVVRTGTVRTLMYVPW